MIDRIGELGINVIVHMQGREAEGGWELEAWNEESNERWTVESDSVYAAACGLAELVGIDLKDG